jgi:hypothetical protein
MRDAVFGSDSWAGMRMGTPRGRIQGLPDSSMMAGKLHWLALELTA